MKNKEIIPAVVGGVFFAVPYLGLSLSLAPALAIGCTGFGASKLVLSGVKTEETIEKTDRKSYLKINTAKKQNKEIQSLIPKIESEITKQNLNQIYQNIEKIISTAEKKPKKMSNLDNFFDYYLPVLILFGIISGVIIGTISVVILKKLHIKYEFNN